MTKWIATRGSNGSNAKTCYHTREDCRYLNGANYRPTSDEEIEFYNLHECKYCADEYENNGGKNSKFVGFREEAHEL